MASITHYVEQRLKLQGQPPESRWLTGRRSGPLLGFRFAYRSDEVRVLRRPPTRQTRQGPLRELTSRRWGVSMERRSRRSTASRSGGRPTSRSPTHLPVSQSSTSGSGADCGRFDGRSGSASAPSCASLRAARHPEHDARRWAFSRKGYWRIAGSPILATALPNGYWASLGLQGFTGPYRRFRDAKRNRPVRTCTPGGVGGVGASSAPTRFSRGARHSNVPGRPGESGRAVGPARTRLRRVADFSALTPTTEVRQWQLRDRDVRRRCRRQG